MTAFRPSDMMTSAFFVGTNEKEGFTIPNTRSAKKRLRQSLIRRERNLQRKQALRRVMKQYKKALAAGDQAKAQELVPELMKAADKAAKHRTIHPNKAARIKSRLMKRLQALP